MFLQISTPTGKEIIIGNVYRPPKMLVNDLTAFLESFESAIRNVNCINCIIAGDFNINLLELNTKPKYREYVETVLSEGFCPVISYPTRISDTSATLIDNILIKTSAPLLSNTLSGILMNAISDHQPCFTALQISEDTVNHNDNTRITITTRTENFINLVETDLAGTDIMGALNIENDVHTNYDIFAKIISRTIDNHTSTKQIKPTKYNYKRSPWITDGILISIKYRDSLNIKKKKATGTPRYELLKSNLKAYNKILNKLKKRAKAMYYINTFRNCKNDGKETWKHLNNLLKRKPRSGDDLPDYINHNGTKVTTVEGILDSFNSHFATIGKEVADSVSPSVNSTYADYLDQPTQSTFEFNRINTTFVETIIDKQLKNKSSSGYDNISSKLLKQLKTQLIEPLTFLINQSIDSGKFPNLLKLAKIKTLFKKGDAHDTNNYRPISLLPAFSKIFEKVLLNQLVDYFNEHSLFYKSQYGFRNKHSTELAVLELIDYLTQVADKGKTPFSVFIDLSKAFDCLDHSILIKKLQYYGIQGKALDLLTDYLQDRTQFTYHRGKKSSNTHLTTGVPQGSILGPFLFLVYMNDFSNCNSKLSIINYADDTVLSSTLCSFVAPTSTNINLELAKVSEWLSCNKLCVNTGKSKALVFTGQKRNVNLPSFILNGTQLEIVDSFNYLGVIISKDFKWNKHVASVSAKISKTIGIMKQIKHYVPSYILKLIYQSLIMCKLSYGILVWGKNPSNLVKLQKKAVRIIANANFNAHTEPIFKDLKLLRVDDLYNLKILTFYYNYINHKLPEYFTNNFIHLNEQNHNYNTRLRGNLTLPRIRHEYLRGTLRYAVAQTINACPSLITEKTRTHSLRGYATYAQNYYLSKYSAICSIQNCYICNIHRQA